MKKTMMKLYKTYDTDGNPVLFNSVSDVRKAFDLTDDEVRRVFLPGVHVVAFGVEIVTY